MQIVLMGYMASGKSAVGKQLASVLSCKFIDLDHYIEAKEQSTISNVFNTKGEIYFRKKETEYLKELLQNGEQMVLALGGGTPCYGNNLDLILNSDCHLIYLRASLDLLVERLVSEKHKRPLVAHLKTKEELTDFVRKHLFERSAFYNRANTIITVDHKSLNEVVEQLVLPLF